MVSFFMTFSIQCWGDRLFQCSL